MKDFSFGRGERLLRREDYLKAGARGKKVRTRNFIVLVDENALGIRRLGITASRKTGNAVCRNRIKRVLREFFRLNRERLRPSCDYLVIAGVGSNRLSCAEVTEELLGALARARLLATGNRNGP